MSIILLSFVESFLKGRLSAEIFSEAYMELWKIERDNGFTLSDEPSLSECLSSIFCASDTYCPDETLRRECEFDEEQLRKEVSSLVEVYKGTKMP